MSGFDIAIALAVFVLGVVLMRWLGRRAKELRDEAIRMLREEGEIWP